MSEPQERRRLLRAKYQIPTPALFLDRDGVLIKDRHHLCDPTEVSLCPGSKELLEAAHKENWAVVVITNQSESPGVTWAGATTTVSLIGCWHS